jgi:hypothetical protein
MSSAARAPSLFVIAQFAVLHDTFPEALFQDGARKSQGCKPKAIWKSLFQGFIRVYQEPKKAASGRHQRREIKRLRPAKVSGNECR